VIVMWLLLPIWYTVVCEKQMSYTYIVCDRLVPITKSLCVITRNNCRFLRSILS